MIPIRLNLISPKKKQYHTHVVYVQFAKNMLELLLLGTIIFSIILVYSVNTLEDRALDISASTTVSESQFVQINREIKKVNDATKRIDTIQKKYTLWTPILVELTKHIPEAVQLHSLSINSKNGTLLLAGRAKTRDDLLALESQLRLLPWVKDVTIPITQLIEKEDVPFSITASLKE